MPNGPFVDDRWANRAKLSSKHSHRTDATTALFVLAAAATGSHTDLVFAFQVFIYLHLSVPVSLSILQLPSNRQHLHRLHCQWPPLSRRRGNQSTGQSTTRYQFRSSGLLLLLLAIATFDSAHSLRLPLNLNLSLSVTAPIRY